mgnify:CR=1 FL=1
MRHRYRKGLLDALVKVNKCGGCERHNDMIYDPHTTLPRWANTTWAVDENLCRKPAEDDLAFAPCDPDLCLEEQQRCLALPKRKRGDVPCPVSCPVAPETCPHTLAHYCGSGGANKGSMAWLEAALLSIVLALFISNTISIFVSKGVVPMLARAVLNKKAGPSQSFEEERKQEEDLQDADAAYMATFQPEVTEPPTPKRTALQMLIDRVDTRARKIRVELAEEAARRDPTIDDVIEVTHQELLGFLDARSLCRLETCVPRLRGVGEPVARRRLAAGGARRRRLGELRPRRQWARRRRVDAAAERLPHQRFARRERARRVILVVIIVVAEVAVRDLLRRAEGGGRWEALLFRRFSGHYRCYRCWYLFLFRFWRFLPPQNHNY